MIPIPSVAGLRVRKLSADADAVCRTPRRMHECGQALAEFALIVPLMLLLAVALGDFGRLFNAAIAVESAAREAADYGAMQGKIKWDSTMPLQIAQNETDMRMRACTAASTLSDYVGDPPGTANMTCANPTFAYDIERMPGTGDCSTQTEFQDPCIIHVTMTYDFHMFLNFPPLPTVFHMTRESRFAISDLGNP
jgi:Flp pilus assembly protein TadG